MFTTNHIYFINSFLCVEHTLYQGPVLQEIAVLTALTEKA
jgi:hypothetical protein